MIHLEAGAARVAMSPEDGGRVASIQVDGLELLITEGPTPRRWGAFPMAPWAGRLRHGELHFGGETYHFPLTNPPHGIHGTVYDLHWQDDGNGSISTDLGPLWPFGGRAVHRFRLEPDALHLTLEVHA